MSPIKKHKILLFFLLGSYFFSTSLNAFSSSFQHAECEYSKRRIIIEKKINEFKGKSNALTYIESTISTSDAESIALKHYATGYYYYKKKNHIKAVSAFEDAIKIFNGLNLESEKAICYLYIGKIKTDENEKIGIELLNASVNIFKTNKDFEYLLKVYLVKANYYSQNKNHILAEKEYLSALELVNNKISPNLIDICYLNLANHYNQKTEFDKALEYYLKLEQRISSKKNHPRLGLLYNNLGVLFLRKENWNLAESYFIKSLKIKENKNDSLGIINTSQNLFRVYLRQNKTLQASHFHTQLNNYFKDSKPLDEVYLDFMFNCVHYHILNNSTELAIEALHKYSLANDSTANAAFSDKLIDMQKSFEMLEKDREIELLQKEDALQKAKLNNQKLVTLSVSVLALLLIGIGVLVNRQRRRLQKSQHILKQRKQEIIAVNEELQRSNRSKDRILAVIGHDLRGPVGGLKELIELYMDLGEFEPEDFHNLLSAARESSTSTYHLLENLLSWANSQRGQIEFKPETALIKELICHTVQLLDKAVNTRGIQFKCDVPEELQLTVDKNMLNTIVRNLVSNAIKFSPEKSTVAISATEQAEEVILCIADEGIGFSAKESENLFTHKEAYFLENGNSAKGTGLGLILCKEFVERHGGRIWTVSDQKKGAKVCFSLPKELKELTPMVEVPVKKPRKKWRAWSNLF